MKKHTLLLLIAGLWATLLSSCFVPRTVVKIDADTPDVTWSYGRQIVEHTQDSLSAKVYFDTYNKSDLIFDVEVVNRSGRKVLVSPEDIYLKCEGGNVRRNAADPEKVLLNEAIERSRQDANAKNLAVALGVATVATVVAVAATDSGGGGSGGGDVNNIGNSFVIVNNYVAPPLPAPSLPPSTDFWANFSLRKTTLEPDFKVGGKVVIARYDECQLLEVFVPVGETTLKARFKQQIIQP